MAADIKAEAKEKGQGTAPPALSLCGAILASAHLEIALRIEQVQHLGGRGCCHHGVVVPRPLVLRRFFTLTR